MSTWKNNLKDILIYSCVCHFDHALYFLCPLNMSRPALPADNVHTIQLPVAGCSIPEGRLCKMYGWGETKGTDILYSTFTTAVVYNTYSPGLPGLQYIAFILHFSCSSPGLLCVFFFYVYIRWRCKKYIGRQSSLK